MEPHPRSIPEIESALQQALGSLRGLEARGELPPALKPLLELAPPVGGSVHVSLRERDSGRPVGPELQAQGWSSRGCGAWIVHEVPLELSEGDSRHSGASGRSAGPLRDFILALDHVEKDPHLRFVSLKWFRDTYLPRRGFDWASAPDLPRQVVHEAAEREIILTAKVPNPKTPEFPVTTIRLNREHALVMEFLAAAKDTSRARIPSDEDSRPVEA